MVFNHNVCKIKYFTFLFKDKEISGFLTIKIAIIGHFMYLAKKDLLERPITIKTF